ncbi:MAG TPA: YkgJ family cysteine cluster protein [Anaerolineae bacterium]|nr:YkgJ family cysteine cluster protein [Anaerolineae bacterium]
MDVQNPCQVCGACCASFRVSFYWAEASDVDEASVPESLTCQVAPLLCAMKGTDQPHPFCAALLGIVGIKTRCRIYEQRPSVCREFVCSGLDGKPNPRCDHAREIWGLPPLLLATSGT